MKFKIEEATKSQSKLRCAIYGPSGAGKTFTALAIAHGMGNKILVIDTERKSASKYANRTEEPIFKFQTINLVDATVENYIGAIKAAALAGYEILIIDSLSHAWQAILDEVDKLAKGKFKGNSWGAWSEGTPMQKRLVDAILSYDGHVFCTMRAKTDWLTEQGNNGKPKPVRVGLSPEQGKGIEYEFDLLIEISVDHVGEIIKDRTGKFQDKSFAKPGKEFGQELVNWLNEGLPQERAPEPIKAPVLLATPHQIETLKKFANQLMIPESKILEGCRSKGYGSLEEVTADYMEYWIDHLSDRAAKTTKSAPPEASTKTYDQLIQQEV